MGLSFVHLLKSSLSLPYKEIKRDYWGIYDVQDLDGQLRGIRNQKSRVALFIAEQYRSVIAFLMWNRLGFFLQFVCYYPVVEESGDINYLFVHVEPNIG